MRFQKYCRKSLISMNKHPHHAELMTEFSFLCRENYLYGLLMSSAGCYCYISLLAPIEARWAEKKTQKRPKHDSFKGGII